MVFSTITAVFVNSKTHCDHIWCELVLQSNYARHILDEYLLIMIGTL